MCNRILVDIDELVVPENFVKPSRWKRWSGNKFYRDWGILKSPIIVDKNNNILDGYTSYLTAKTFEIKKLEVYVYERNK